MFDGNRKEDNHIVSSKHLKAGYYRPPAKRHLNGVSLAGRERLAGKACTG